MKFEHCLFAVLFTAVLALGTARAADPSVGRDLAVRWCASCHAIAPGRASDEQAPSFESIVGERARSDAWIDAWLSAPHEKMPDLSLTRHEISALIAYLDSLRSAQ